METAAIIETPGSKKCSNCQAETEKLTTGRCNPCYRWFKKNHVERRTNITPVAALDIPSETALPTEVTVAEESLQEAPSCPLSIIPDETLLPTPSLETSQPETADEALPLSSATGTETAAAVPAMSEATQLKVEAVLALAQEGPEAIAQAIRRGSLRVQLPRASRGQTSARETTERQEGDIATCTNCGKRFYGHTREDRCGVCFTFWKKEGQDRTHVHPTPEIIVGKCVGGTVQQPNAPSTPPVTRSTRRTRQTSSAVSAFRSASA